MRKSLTLLSAFRSSLCHFSSLSTSGMMMSSSNLPRAAFARSGNVSIENLPQLPTPGPGEVRLRIAWSGVNRADTLQRRGNYAPPPGASAVLGLEAAGVIEEVGEGVSPSLGVGSRAMALLGGGGNAAAVIVRSDHCLTVPDTMTLRTAAAIPENWLTAFQLLFVVAAGDVDANLPAALKLGTGVGPCRAGATIVIHAAASGVGTAAVQLAVAAGARVIAIAGSEEKMVAVKALGATECVNYKEDANTFPARLKAAVGASGAALILDPVGASFAHANLDVLATDGVWVLYGGLGGMRILTDGAPGVADALFGQLLRRRATLTATTLRNRSDAYKARLVARFAAEALPLLTDSRLSVVIDSEFDLEDLTAAHTKMESNVTLGKILVRIDSSIN
jgi:tumor protein p53-inducible protein 3